MSVKLPNHHVVPIKPQSIECAFVCACLCKHVLAQGRGRLGGVSVVEIPQFQCAGACLSAWEEEEEEGGGDFICNKKHANVCKLNWEG